MLNVEILSPNQIEKAATIFHRDGFVAIKDALTPAQLQTAQAGARRVIAEQTAAIKLEEANRGFARYSFGDQTRHPEWTMLIDLPTILPILNAIWSSEDYSCSGAGGDYSVPGAKIQHLHSDMGDFFRDPLGQTTFHDIPAPFIVVNFMMVDFRRENGAIRFVPATQRSRHAPPKLEEEPEWMQNSILCAPAGTAVIRDVRCWHGGTANSSDEIRPMTSVGYHAPWYRTPHKQVMPRDVYDTLSSRARELCRTIVED
jgi:ectoine hydroxylase-related dioxygenase (phytanoyl-CoA dioxygenase family)